MKQKSMRLKNSVLITFPLAELLGDLLVGLALDLGEPDLGRESLPFLVKSVLGSITTILWAKMLGEYSVNANKNKIGTVFFIKIRFV
jgi:hypothetical protein